MVVLQARATEYFSQNNLNAHESVGEYGYVKASTGAVRYDKRRGLANPL